ncbi:MAG: histidinol-phosphate aminotransferase family protein [Thermoleophilia bacterium]|nr:histidinol-phosphate aminotransferase family protein [Thermoleophilia bacterium]
MPDEKFKDVKDLFQPWVMEAPQYSIAGCDVAWEHPELGRMFLNENPIRPSQAVIDAAMEALTKANWYPDRMLRLRRKLADLHGVGPENIAVANGSSETIDAMMRIFMKPGDEFMCSVPTFEMFPSRAGLCGCTTVQIPLRESDLQYDVDAMLAAVNEKTKLILIINPNNPTGIFIDDADLTKFCELGIPLCVDEAYLDYHPQVEAKTALLEKYPHVFLSHTFSKAYGLAGVRFGYVVAHPDLAEAFDRMFLPWNVSLMAMAAAEAILDNPSEIEEKVRYNNKWMDIFVKELEAKGLKPFPPHGNYMLVDGSVTGKTSQEIVDAAKDMAHVLIKTIKPIHGNNSYFRVTPGAPDDNERFVGFIRTYFGS